MKAFMVFILTVLLTFFQEVKAQDSLLVLNFNDLSFSEFADIVHEQTGIRIFYRDEWVNSRTYSVNEDSISVREALSLILGGSGLMVSNWGGDLVLLPGIQLLSELPAYAQASESVKLPDRQGDQLTVSEARYMTGRRQGVSPPVVIGRPGEAVQSNTVRALGRVIDEETGEPLHFVAVYVIENHSGVTTDLNGFFNLALQPGTYNVQLELLGYERNKYIFEVYSDDSFVLRIKKTAVELQEIIVNGERHENIRAREPGFDQVSMKSIRTLPMMMGERDILKISSTLPGIVTVGEGTAGINVRGSNSDQNAFYLNGIPVYNTFHLFGFFPAFNSDIVRDLSVYKGYIPVQYGGRLASVFNVTSRQGNRKHFTVHGGISPVTANMVLEGPLKKDTSSILLSVRSSYSDWILSRIKDPVISSSQARFNDFAGAVNRDFRKSQLSLFFYRSYDYFNLSGITGYEYYNNGASVIMGHNHSNSLRSEFTLTGSQYGFSTTDSQQTPVAYRHGYRMEHYEAKTGFRHMLNEKNTLWYGAGIILYHLDRGTVEPYGPDSRRMAAELGTGRGLETSLYVSDAYDLNSRIKLNLGLRYMLYTPLGPEEIVLYTPGAPRDPRYAEDTLMIGRNGVIRWYHEPEIRAALNIETDKNGSIKMAFNQMHQNLFMLNAISSVAPNTQWKLSDYHLSPSASNQFSFGLFRTLPENGIDFSAEAFLKMTRNYSEFRDGADFLSEAPIETAVLQGKQKAYGIELYARRSRRKLEGWISYTWSRSLIHVNGDHFWYRINGGDPYPSDYDVPHSLTAVLNYYFSRRLFVSSILTYQTGKPVTYPESVFYSDNTPYLDYSKRNYYRIPDYFRADLSVTVEGDLRKNKLLHNSFVLNLYNATGRRNPYSVYFRSENGRIRSYSYSIIGVPVFTATWIFKLGNYVSD
jgi:hypothetical protein